MSWALDLCEMPFGQDLFHTTLIALPEQPLIYFVPFLCNINLKGQPRNPPPWHTADPQTRHVCILCRPIRARSQRSWPMRFRKISFQLSATKGIPWLKIWSFNQADFRSIGTGPDRCCGKGMFNALGSRQPVNHGLKFSTKLVVNIISDVTPTLCIEIMWCEDIPRDKWPKYIQQ